jgi:CubicO group peptidase (beta-lactamase class C family)
MNRLALGFILLVFIRLPCSAQQAQLHQYLHIQQQRLHFSGVVLVTQNKKMLYSEVIGDASGELHVPINKHTKFRIASVTKQFMAMLVAMAFEERKLNRNDTLAKFFPSLKDESWRRITLHQLLTHCSGIPHNEGITDYWTVKSRLPLNKEQALGEIFAMPLLFAPGTGWKYSSPGYFLLAEILERTYHQPYALLLQQKIFQPLNMAGAGVMTTGKIVDGMSEGYHLIGDSLVTAPHRDLSLMKGSGDMYATAGDLVLWNHGFLSGDTWDTTLKAMLLKNYTGKSPGYGYGWFIREGKRRAYYHGGGTFGCSSLSAWYPEEKMSIVILSNVSVLPVEEIWADIEKIVYKDPFTMPPLEKAVALPPASLLKFAGT